ncbi:Histone-like bacterial DNA-binding protein [Candidatus Omnitrophus magneticus]|uniref:Histone-like bacterial DNA-binding protein n=1 Tax=Candidatus Omnitrophus magneticus TaxID=1609969 RepID=A0A0F0CJ15_9BACT|nr:Histone-like bacterial DNA-binding protein [Candidatus Omnitrophus magneticus]
MNKAEFIQSVQKAGQYVSKAEALKAYNAVVESISGRMAKGNPKERVIRIPELGTFQMKIRKARKGKNPQTGESIKIAAKKVVAFKSSKALSRSL